MLLQRHTCGCTVVRVLAHHTCSRAQDGRDVPDGSSMKDTEELEKGLIP